MYETKEVSCKLCKRKVNDVVQHFILDCPVQYKSREYLMHLIVNSLAVLNHVKEFYKKKLYTCADSDLININLEEIIKVEIPKLEPDTSSSLEAEIAEKEVLEVLKK